MPTDPLLTQNGASNTQIGLHLIELLAIRVPQETVAITISCFPQTDRKSLLLRKKLLHKSLYMEKSSSCLQNLQTYVIVYLVQEGTLQTTKREI